MNASKWYRVGLLPAALGLIALLSVATGAAAPGRALDAPVITSFAPHSGPVGTEVTIRGAHLSGATVSFGTVQAPISGAPRNTIDSQVKFVVPNGAASGLITVTANGASVSTTIPFTITPGMPKSETMPAKPVISTIAPMQTHPGAMIRISGLHLTGVKYVAVGGVKATYFKAASKNKLIVRVPARATSGKVSVVTAYGSGTSLARLTVR